MLYTVLALKAIWLLWEEMHLFTLKVIGAAVSNKSLSFVDLWLLHVFSWSCKVWERGSLLLSMLCVPVSCCVHRGFAVLGPNCMLKSDGLKSIPPWHTFQVWTDWKPSGFWMWPSLEAVYEINSQSTAGLCLPLCYILVMPSNSIWKSTKICKPKLKSDWVKTCSKFLMFPSSLFRVLHGDGFKKESHVLISLYIILHVEEHMYSLQQLWRDSRFSLMYSESLKIMVRERSTFPPRICTEQFSSARTAS